MLQQFWMRNPRREEAGNPEGGGNPPAFDPGKFKTEMMALFNTSINGAIKNLKTELTKKPETEPGKPEPDPEPDPKPGKDKDPATARLERDLAKLRGELETERKARQETESKAKADRLSGTLRAELSKHVAPDRIDAAVRIFSPDVRYGEDGASIIGGSEETPLAEFIETAIHKQHDYLLPAKPVQGVGATSGGRRRAPQLEDIKPGMKPEDLDAVRAAIAEYAGQALKG